MTIRRWTGRSAARARSPANSGAPGRQRAPAARAHRRTVGRAGRAVRLAAPDGAGAAADREAFAVLGIDLGPLPGALADRPPATEPLLPFGATRARRHRVEHLALTLAGLDPGVAWSCVPPVVTLPRCSPASPKPSRRLGATRCCAPNAGWGTACGAVTSSAATSTRPAGRWSRSRP
ncbi:hypothetical protein AB0C38_33045 [Amycolatopsis sp. NPDC048633]|uniref:hypothetical protein n=1 Tax=Amycolatopsis sp. NPDC048633 TaxID=3157095 RepID=UPI00340D2447